MSLEKRERKLLLLQIPSNLFVFPFFIKVRPLFAHKNTATDFHFIQDSGVNPPCADINTFTSWCLTLFIPSAKIPRNTPFTNDLFQPPSNQQHSMPRTVGGPLSFLQWGFPLSHKESTKNNPSFYQAIDTNEKRHRRHHI